MEYVGEISQIHRVTFWGHPLSMYAKCSQKLTFLRTRRTCAFQGVRNVSFLENFVYVLDRWSL